MMRARIVAVLGVLVALVALVSGCSTDGVDARSLIAAVDRFRDAENDAKPAALANIEQVHCNAGEVCTAKDACLAFARPTAAGLADKAKVEKALTAIESKQADAGPTTAADLGNTLSQARDELEKGHQALESCDLSMRKLREHFER